MRIIIIQKKPREDLKKITLIIENIIQEKMKKLEE
jgi:hypothetical protein